jgi:hypothetical protein
VFHEIEQHDLVYVIELSKQLMDFEILMQVHTEFDWIYLQYSYRHHEREVHENTLPNNQKINYPNQFFAIYT